jgi:hypothetical protein
MARAQTADKPIIDDVMTSFSFEIGAIFLLAAMLMYGTVSGFLPRALHAGRTAPIVIGSC